MSSTVRLTSLLGFLVLALSACGGSPPDSCDICTTQEAEARCSPTSGCDDPGDPAPVLTPFPAAGNVSSPTASVAREQWGQPCVEEVVSNSPFTTRWTYGAEACGTNGSKWCSAFSCTTTSNRIYLTFVNSVLNNVSQVTTLPPPPLTATVYMEVANTSSVSRDCFVTARWVEGGQTREKGVVPTTYAAPGGRFADVVVVPPGTDVTMISGCYAQGQPGVQQAVATFTKTAAASCNMGVDYSYAPATPSMPEDPPSVKTGSDC